MPNDDYPFDYGNAPADGYLPTSPKMMAIGRGSTCPMTITRLTMETRRLMAICPLRRGAPLRWKRASR